MKRVKQIYHRCHYGPFLLRPWIYKIVQDKNIKTYLLFQEVFS